MLYIQRVKRSPFRGFYQTNTSGSHLLAKQSPSKASVLSSVLVTHAQAIKVGSIVDTYTANNILSEYTKLKDFILAHHLFNEIPFKDTISWNTMVTGYTDVGDHVAALEFAITMTRNGFAFDQYTFGSILKGIAYMGYVELGKQVHSIIVKTSYDKNVFSGSALLDMYAKCNMMQDAYAVFECIPERNFVSWNALIRGYAQIGDRWKAFLLFHCMENEGVNSDEVTFTSLLTLLDRKDFYKITLQIHAKIVKRGKMFNTTTCNAIITSYSECESIDDSEKVFERLDAKRDLVTWNSMLAAYMLHEQDASVIELFVKMQRLGIEQDMYTYTSAISACFVQEHQKQGRSLHALVIKRGFDQSLSVCNSVVAMYSKSSMDDALNLFYSMDVKDSYSWNSILTGFSQNGFSEDALKFFGRMQSLSIVTDHYAFSAVLRSSSELASLQLGQQIHVLVIKSNFESNDFVASSLIYMYAKCGIIEDARKSFEMTPKDSSITWNSIIFGYAQHGQGKVALELFSKMLESHVKPDHITFVAVLTSCSHIGLVEHGANFLKSMETSYGISPRMEHYACGVDLFGRAGRLKEAKELIESMPFEPDAMVWKTLLGGCRMNSDMELASEVARKLLVLEPDEHCIYVLLFNMYGCLGRWDECATVKKMMRERGVKKVPGWSWIEVKNEVHAFNAEDRSHPQCEAIYWVLGELMEELKFFGYSENLHARELNFEYLLGDCE
ncbi:hypothetical protein Syun_028257 [Stephania yunnanensis]|uniref:Pentatricopeptide repeat-containing protein n=1 Tax=Stephania yunnanensis TaxID=152371 RepID=A0AAP0HQY7_9MAGN